MSVMVRQCFVCKKPLPVEKRATVYCSLRCQELDRQLRHAPVTEPTKPRPGDARGSWRDAGRYAIPLHSRTR